MDATHSSATDAGRTRPNAADTILEIEDIHTQFFTREGLVRAVDGVSYRVGRGETLGVVGESPGRNASEPTGGPVKERVRRPSRPLFGEGSMTRRNLIDASWHSGGVVGAAR